MHYTNKVEGLYEGFAYDISGEEYYFDEEVKPSCHKAVVKCIKRTLSQLDRVSNQTEGQHKYWNACIRYANSL